MSVVVDPHNYLPHLIVWFTLNTFAACSNLLLLIVTLASQRLDANLLLVNLLIIFVITPTSSSILAWSGHALEIEPPFGVCLWSALVAMSDVPLEGGAAFVIVLKVWGSVMTACRPHWRRQIEWIVWTPFLIALPYVSALPLFLVGLGIGLGDRSRVYRASPFYCIVDNDTLQNAASGFGAGYTFLCLVFAAWITWLLISTRWRVRRVIEYPDISYPFVLRTLLFSIFVGVAFVVGILSLTSTFSAIVPDVVLSSCSVAVFFIFSTSRPVLHFVFRCQRVRSVTTTTSLPASPTAWRSAASNTISISEAPQELVALSFSKLSNGSSKAPSKVPGDESSWWAHEPTSPQ